MDFSSFTVLGLRTISKKIGQYKLYIFRGIFDITISIPKEDNLDWNKYTVLGVSVGSGSNGDYTVDLLDLGLSLNGYHVTDRYYNLPILELENVYNKLCELAGEPVKLNKIKEKPCYRCGEMNDIGAFACWSFTCGVSNPTGV